MYVPQTWCSKCVREGGGVQEQGEGGVEEVGTNGRVGWGRWQGLRGGRKVGNNRVKCGYIIV